MDSLAGGVLSGLTCGNQHWVLPNKAGQKKTVFVRPRSPYSLGHLHILPETAHIYIYT